MGWQVWRDEGIARVQGVHHVRGVAVAVLGSVIGWLPPPASGSAAPRTILDVLEAKLQALEPLLEYLKDPRMPNNTKFMHQGQVVNPTRGMIFKLISCIINLVCERASLPSPLPPAAQSLLHLPGRLGGVGLRSATRTLLASYWERLRS